MAEPQPPGLRASSCWRSPAELPPPRRLPAADLGAGEWSGPFDSLDGTTILIEDRNEDAGTVWVREMAMTSADTTFVAVMVSYPADADPTVSAEGLLDRAVQAAADLPED